MTNSEIVEKIDFYRFHFLDEKMKFKRRALSNKVMNAEFRDFYNFIMNQKVKKICCASALVRMVKEVYRKRNQYE